MRTAVDAAMAVLILLVQLIIYPSFRAISDDNFIAWHRRYVTIIGFIVIPLMFIQAGCIGMQVLAVADGRNMLSALAVLGAGVVTFTISAPCHRVLQRNGKDPETITRLIRTNWIRTVCWIIVWAAGFMKTLSAG